jgi:hypothetical protein
MTDVAALRFGGIGISGHAHRIAVPALRASAETYLLGAVSSRAERSVEDNLRLEARRLRGAGASVARLTEMRSGDGARRSSWWTSRCSGSLPSWSMR